MRPNEGGAISDHKAGVAAIDGTGVRHKPPAIEVSVVIVNYNGKSYVETCIN